MVSVSAALTHSRIIHTVSSRLRERGSKCWTSDCCDRDSKVGPRRRSGPSEGDPRRWTLGGSPSALPPPAGWRFCAQSAPSFTATTIHQDLRLTDQILYNRLHM